MTIHIYGNGGTLYVDGLGNVFDYDPSEEAAEGDHEGYAGIVWVDLGEWLRAYDLDGSQLPGAIDILDVNCHFRNGFIEHAEPEWRAMCKGEDA